MPTLETNEYFLFTALQGVFGNLLTLEILYVEGDPDYVSSVTDTAITITLGMTGGVTNLDWAAVAVLFNADANMIVLASMLGRTGDRTYNSGGTFTGGSSGGGQGVYVLKSFGGVYSWAKMGKRAAISFVK